MNYDVRLTVDDAEKSIEKVVIGLLGRDMRRFKCTRVILYYLDRRSALLEPICIVPEVPYRDLQPIASDPRCDDFIANRAYNEANIIYSLNPDLDARWSREARAVMSLYGITGAVIACPLPAVVDASDQARRSPVGVLVVCANTHLNAPNPELEINEFLRNDLRTLGTLLTLREEILARETAENHERLTRSILEHMRPVALPKHILSGFKQQCKVFLNATSIVLDVKYQGASLRDADPEEVCLSNRESVAATVRSAIEDSHTAAIVLNRPHHHRELYDFLARLQSRATYVWAGVRVEEDDIDTVCFVGRVADMLADHWTEHDITFLERSLHLVHVVLKRSIEFQTLLSQLRQADTGRDSHAFSRSRFDFLYYLCREFLGVDQLLLTRVTREATGYRIKGVIAEGFGDHNDWLVAATDRWLTNEQIETENKIDVMPHILRDYLRATENGLPPQEWPIRYLGAVGDSVCNFIINEEVVAKCHLRGNICFLPCYSETAAGSKALESILHLGQSHGDLALDDAVSPLLGSMADSVAEALADYERERRGDLLKKMRTLHEVNGQTLRTVVDTVRDICLSVGATVFFRLPAVHLIRWPEISIDAVSRAFERLLATHERWNTVLTDAEIKSINAMIADCLGLTESEYHKLLNKHFHYKDVAPLLAESTYIRVACTGLTVEPGPAHKAIEVSAAKVKETEFLRVFPNFLVTNCYLAGYGLTGWVLRYRSTLLLADKRPATISRFCGHMKSSFEPTSIGHIIQGLGECGIESILSRQSVVEPLHVNHIRDRADTSNVGDTYLACAMEDVDDSRFPIGAIRTSTSAGLRVSFDLKDEEAVEAVARHFSWILRREYAQQGHLVAAYSGFKEMSRWVNHNRGHFTDAVNRLRRTEATPDADRQKAIDELDTFGRQIQRFGRQDRLIRIICQLPERGTTFDQLVNCVREVTDFSAFPTRVTMGCRCRSEPLPFEKRTRELVLGLSLITDELIANSIRHSPVKPKELRVLIGGNNCVEIQVIEVDTDTDVIPGQLLPLSEVAMMPYVTSMAGTGTGTTMIRDISSRLGLKVLMSADERKCRVYQVYTSVCVLP